jgi:hypothetical protein
LPFLPIFGLSEGQKRHFIVKLDAGGVWEHLFGGEQQNIVKKQLRGRVGVRETCAGERQNRKKNATWWASWRPGKTGKRILIFAKIRMERGVGGRGAHENELFCDFPDERNLPLFWPVGSGT